MIRRIFLFLLFTLAVCNNITLFSVQPKKNFITFDELDQYEGLIEETETVTARVQEVKIPTYAHYLLNIGSWFFVQYHAFSQKCAALYTILVNGAPDDENS